MADLPIEGGCLCGAIRYELTETPLHSTICHCRMCQKASGAAIVPWVTVPIEAFRVTKGALKDYRSSPPASRGFCGNCGTQISFWHEARGEEIDVSLASLDDQDAWPPTRQIFTASRPAYMKGFDPDLPGME